MTPEFPDLGEKLERFRASCREAGVKLTHQRMEIFREVAASTAHPDAEAVYQGVRSRIPSVSLDTVYRTLWLLNDMGLLTTLGQRRESVRFDANLSPHHHYVCESCGLTRDFESQELDALRIPSGVQGFGSVSATRVEVRGLCAACSSSSPAPGR